MNYTLFNSFLENLIVTVQWIINPQNGYIPIGCRVCKHSKDWLWINKTIKRFVWIPQSLFKQANNNSKNAWDHYKKKHKIELLDDIEFQSKFAKYLDQPNINKIRSQKIQIQSSEKAKERRQEVLKFQERNKVVVSSPFPTGQIVDEVEEIEQGEIVLKNLKKPEFQIFKKPFVDPLKHLWEVVLQKTPKQVEQQKLENANSGVEWLAKQFAEKKKSVPLIRRLFRSSKDLNEKYNLPTFDWWANRLLDLNEIIASKLTNKHNRKRVELWTKQGKDLSEISAVKQFKTKVTMFLNYTLLAHEWHQFPDILLTFLDKQYVESYINALTDPEQFGHSNEGTIRGYMDMLVTMFKFVLDRNLVPISEEFKVRSVQAFVREHYQHWSSHRDDALKEKKSIGFHLAIGKYAGMKDWVRLFQNCIDTCTAWIYHFNLAKEEEEEEEMLSYIQKYGWHYHDCFVMIFMLLTYFNRAEVYYQGTLDMLKMFHMIPDDPEEEEFYQYAYIFTGPEKVSRAVDSSSFPFGENFNALCYFYKIMIHPKIANRKVNSLFVNRSGEAIRSTRADSFTKIVKRVTKAFWGFEMSSRDIRYHGNAHFKLHLNLGADESALLDKATNHDEVTAKIWYTYNGALEGKNRKGSTIITKFLNFGNEPPITLKEEMDQKLTPEEIDTLTNLINKLPGLAKLMKKHDSTIEVMRKRDQSKEEEEDQSEEEEEDQSEEEEEEQSEEEEEEQSEEEEEEQSEEEEQNEKAEQSKYETKLISRKRPIMKEQSSSNKYQRTK